MRRGRHLAAVLAAAVILSTAVAGVRAAGNGAQLNVYPPTVAVAKGQVFALQVNQDSPVDTSGAQASVDFDPSLLQVVSVSRGSGYADAPVFVPQDPSQVVRRANATGHLAQIAAAFTPPDRVPAGTATFLIVRFQAIGCGQTDIGLPANGPFNAQMISGQAKGYGKEIPVTTTGGHVTTCVGPDQVTGQDIAAGQGTDGGAPIGLFGLAGALVLAAVTGALALRSRRPAAPDDEFVD